MGDGKVKFQSLIEPNKPVKFFDWAKGSSADKDVNAAASESKFAGSIKDEMAKYETKKNQPIVSTLFRKA